MRGYQGVYNLERKIYEGAVRGLSPVRAPLSVKFPLPDPRDPFSLRPGSLSAAFNTSNPSKVESSPNLTAAIAGARAAATQFSKHNTVQATSTPVEYKPVSSRTRTRDKDDVQVLNGGLPSSSKASKTESSPNLNAATTGARAAATQFSKHNSVQGTATRMEYRPVSSRTSNRDNDVRNGRISSSSNAEYY